MNSETPQERYELEYAIFGVPYAATFATSGF
jgi:hypothetical protein